ncbi:MAG: hypothetical protein HKM03_09555 [Steroidobacteraceae bacterium]|nr:hypothetical protein [Steroidobacteraceae bacterium]
MSANASFFDLNGNNELTGQAYLQDYGVAYGPIGISNTNAIERVRSGPVAEGDVGGVLA